MYGHCGLGGGALGQCHLQWDWDWDSIWGSAAFVASTVAMVWVDIRSVPMDCLPFFNWSISGCSGSVVQGYVTRSRIGIQYGVLLHSWPLSIQKKQSIGYPICAYEPTPAASRSLDAYHDTLCTVATRILGLPCLHLPSPQPRSTRDITDFHQLPQPSRSVTHSMA